MTTISRSQGGYDYDNRGKLRMAARDYKTLASDLRFLLQIVTGLR